MEIILEYKNAVELKRKIIDDYLATIKKQAEWTTMNLADKNWASNDSDYHKRCRANSQKILSEVKKQLKLLKS